MDRGQKLTNMLFEQGWQHLASSPLKGTPNTIDIYAKNGRLIIAEEFGPNGEHGVEVFYPSSTRTLDDLAQELEAYASDRDIIITTNKVTV